MKIGGGDEQPWYTVVGICNDVHSRSLDASPELQMYVPIHQNLSRNLTLAIRVNDASVAGSIRETVAAVAPGVPVFAVAEMQHFIDELTADRRFVSLLLGYFALIAIVLTGAGVYGLASYFVLQRTRELGVRAALGADRYQIARVVLDNGLRLAVPGLVGGWILIALSRPLLDHLVFGVDSLEVTILLTSSFLLLGILALSHLVPVLRAARIDPVLALRGE